MKNVRMKKRKTDKNKNNEKNRRKIKIIKNI